MTVTNDYIGWVRQARPISPDMIDLLLSEVQFGRYSLGEVRNAISNGLKVRAQEVGEFAPGLKNSYIYAANDLDNGKPVAVLMREIPSE